MTAFPALSEAFTLNEMAVVEEHGLEVVAISLSRPRDRVTHPDARLFEGRTIYLSYDPLALIFANLRALLRSPRRYAHAGLYAITGHPSTWFSLQRGRSALWKSLLLFPFLVEVAARLRARGVRHVHASTVAISGTAAIILSRLLGVPYSLTGHGGDLWFYAPDDLQRRIERAGFFTTVSEDNRRRLLRRFPSLDPDLVHVIRLGVYLDRFLPRRVEAPGTDAADPLPVLVTVARLDPLKGYDTLLQTARILVERDVEYRWALIGDGPIRRELEDAISCPPLNGRVEILGFRSQDEVRDLLRGASLFILPSRSEGLPVVLMEALACGVPCISTPINGIPEIVRHGSNGLLVSAGDPVALADAVERLLRHPAERRRLAHAARPSVEGEYDIRLTGRRIADLLRRSLA